MEDWDEITKASVFLKRVKEHNITYKRLKKGLFSRAAIAFIVAVRKHGQPAFKDLKKSHSLWYMTKVALRTISEPTKQSEG